jgi:hypothetical protein
MSKFCRHNWFQYWYRFVYTTLLLTHSVHNHCAVIYAAQPGILH